MSSLRRCDGGVHTLMSRPRGVLDQRGSRPVGAVGSLGPDLRAGGNTRFVGRHRRHGRNRHVRDQLSLFLFFSGGFGSGGIELVRNEVKVSFSIGEKMRCFLVAGSVTESTGVLRCDGWLEWLGHRNGRITTSGCYPCGWEYLLRKNRIKPKAAVCMPASKRWKMMFLYQGSLPVSSSFYVSF